MRSRSFSPFPVLALTLASVLTPFSYAAPPNRIANVATANRTAVPNTISGRVKHAADMGGAPANKLLTGVTLRFSMTTEQQTALSQLLSDQQNPNSPRYRQWLTPEQFGAQFGLSSTDLAAVSNWVTSQGLTVTGVARSGTFMQVSGTVGQIESAFSTSIHTLSSRGEQNISNVTDPQLPAAIANVVTGITGLNDFKAKPRLRRVKADFTSSVSPGNHYFAPGDFYTVYNVTPLLGGTNVAGTSTWVKSAYNIAVIGQVQVSPTSTTSAGTDVSAFRSASGLSTNLPTAILTGQTPGYPANCLTSTASSCDDLAESDLDLEWAGAVSPSSAIAFVYSQDFFNTSLTYAIDNNIAPIVTMSYGLCEADFGPATMAAFNQLFQLANAQGITLINSSGDSGATTCDGDNDDYPAILGLSVSFPASSPYVTAVGGTMFNEGNATGATTYWGASNGTTSGSALSYIPEIPWNESSVTNGLGSGGGGVSSYFPKPAWQVGAGVPNDGARDVPDVSLNAASIHDPYLYCSAGFCTNGYRNSSQGLLVAGGTSFGAPSFAGILALVEQKLGARIGNANPYIYGLAAQQSSNAVYHDVTSGNNNSQCVPGTPNCTSAATEGYTAGANYDLATGWGSVNAAFMASFWTSATPTGVGAPVLISSYTYVTTATTTSCGVQGTLVLNVNVFNGTANAYSSKVTTPVSTTIVPTGTVQFTVDGVAFGTPQPLTNGSLANYSLNIGSLSGVHTIGAIYLGDSVYASSAGQLGSSTLSPTTGDYVDVTPIDFVSSTQKDFSVTPCTGNVAAIRGNAGSAIPLTVTPFNGFTGTVTLSAGAISSVSNAAPIGYSFSVSPVTISAATGVPTSLTLYAYQNSSNESSQPVVISALHNPLKGQPWYVPASGGTLACVFLLMLPKRRRWAGLLALALSIAAISATGCSNSVSSGGGGGGTTNPTVVAAPPGLYIVTVTATSGSLVHTTNITFTVN